MVFKPSCSTPFTPFLCLVSVYRPFHLYLIPKTLSTMPMFLVPFWQLFCVASSSLTFCVVSSSLTFCFVLFPHPLPSVLCCFLIPYLLFCVVSSSLTFCFVLFPHPLPSVSFSFSIPRREAGDVWCQSAVCNLRAVICFPFPVSSLVVLATYTPRCSHAPSPCLPSPLQSWSLAVETQVRLTVQLPL